MLTSYTVKGFKSFRDETTVELLPTNYKSLANRNIYNDVLKGALFVGANASGKSNIIMAVKFLTDALFTNYNTEKIEKHMCLFSEDKKMEFTYNFKINSNNIKYYIEYMSDKSFLTEKLYVDGNLILERIGNNAKSYIFNDEMTYDNIANDVLILREIYFNTKFRNNDTLSQWFEFLRKFIYIDLYNRNIFSFNNNVLSAEKYFRKFGDAEINDFFKQYNFNQRIKCQSNDNESISISFIRNGIDVAIPYQMESLGNRLLLELLNNFFYIVKNGGILILDEFSSGFHNDLEELLVRYFMENSKNAQLLFVSHSTNLLSSRLLRPDQIYTVDFEQKKGSVLSRVSKEQPREAQNLEKMYLGGVFGGLPNYENK